MGIFQRIYSIAKAEVNDRLRHAGLFSDDFEHGDLDEELRRLEEELRAAEKSRERRDYRGQTYERQRSSTADDRTSGTPRTPSAYSILGVSPRATQNEIRDMYRKLAKKYHPDRLQQLSPNLQETGRQKMKEINQAWNMISNPRRRQEYDQKLGFI